MTKTLILLSGMFWLALAVGLPAAEEPGDELIQMILNLVSDQDRDMRAVGLQQVREEAKGPAATKRFAGALPKLTPDVQVGLLDALGERGDKAARPAVLEMLKSREETVRAAALRALGLLGEAADVPVLVQSLGSPAGPQKTAARASLVRLRGGEAASAAIAAELKQAGPAIRTELLGVLAARGATESLPIVLEAASDADARVRGAALTALRTLAGPGQTAALVKLLKAAPEGAEQWKAEQALLAVCAQGREACAEPILAGLAGASPSATAALLRALAKSGGEKALGAVVGAVKDPRAEVRREAVRLLANWPDKSAVPHLRTIARQGESLAQQAVAVQGLVRLAGPLKDKPADLPLLAETMQLARRPEEKRMVLGALGGIATPESFALVLPALNDPAVAEEASLAVVLIAEKATALDPVRRRAALEQAQAKAKDPEIRERAEKALKAAK